MHVVVPDIRMGTFGHTQKIPDKAQKYYLTGTCTPKTNKYPNLGYFTNISTNKKMLANFKFGIFFKFWSEEEVGGWWGSLPNTKTQGAQPHPMLFLSMHLHWRGEVVACIWWPFQLSIHLILCCKKRGPQPRFQRFPVSKLRNVYRTARKCVSIWTKHVFEMKTRFVSTKTHFRYDCS